MARERLERIVREKQLESVGVLSPHRTALQAPLEKHLSDYLADLQAVGRDYQYIFDLKNRVRRLIRECHWTLLKRFLPIHFWRGEQDKRWLQRRSMNTWPLLDRFSAGW